MSSFVVFAKKSVAQLFMDMSLTPFKLKIHLCDPVFKNLHSSVRSGEFGALNLTKYSDRLHC